MLSHITLLPVSALATTELLGSLFPRTCKYLIIAYESSNECVFSRHLVQSHHHVHFVRELRPANAEVGIAKKEINQRCAGNNM